MRLKGISDDGMDRIDRLLFQHQKPMGENPFDSDEWKRVESAVETYNAMVTNQMSDDHIESELETALIKMGLTNFEGSQDRYMTDALKYIWDAFRAGERVEMD